MERLAITEIKYNGRYPNLCSGQLIVTLSNGKVFNFPRYCLSSGGSVTFDKDWSEEVSEGEWRITQWAKGFPENLKNELIGKINTEIQHGCCGAVCNIETREVN